MAPEIQRNERGCPCGGDCCDAPDIKSFAEEVPMVGADGHIDEEHFRTECLRCGAACYCDL